MAYLKIYCESCGGTWDVYSRDIMNNNARICPHCGQKIDRRAWESDVIPAFDATQKANAELFKDHVDTHRPLFSFDVVANHLYANRRSTGEKQTLAEALDEIEGAIFGRKS